MGGLFSATIRAPLVGVVLVVELTGGYELILPVIMTCVTAHVVAEWLHGRPIYEVLLERSLRLSGHLPRAPSTTSLRRSEPTGPRCCAIRSSRPTSAIRVEGKFRWCGTLVAHTRCHPEPKAVQCIPS